MIFSFLWALFILFSSEPIPARCLRKAYPIEQTLPWFEGINEYVAPLINLYGKNAYLVILLKMLNF